MKFVFKSALFLWLFKIRPRLSGPSQESYNSTLFSGFLENRYWTIFSLKLNIRRPNFESEISLGNSKLKEKQK